MPEGRHILIIQTAYLGDVVLASSFIEAVHKKYPQSVIHFLLRKGNESLLSSHPHISYLWVWDKESRKHLFHLILKLRAFHFEHVFNIHRFLATGLITLFVKARHKVGFHSNPLSRFFSRRVRHKMPHWFPDGTYLHEVQRNYQLLSDESPPPSKELLPKLYPTSRDRESIRHFDCDMIVAAPASVWPTKQWTLEKWRELVGRLSEKFFVGLIGGPDDYALCEKVRDHKKNIENLCGKLTPLASMALMEKAVRVFVNDSAPLHLASSVNAPVTAIFCSTAAPLGYGPLSDDAKIAEAALPCRPCGLHGKRRCPLQHYRCAHDIDVEEVLKTVPEFREENF